MNISTRVARLLLPVLASAGMVGAVAVGPASATVNPPQDYPYIAGVDMDFGGPGGLLPVLNSPVSPGSLVWDTAGQTVTPILTGTLYVDNSFGLHVRVEMKYFNVFGQWLATRRSPEVWAGSPGVVGFPVSISSYADPAIYKVEISTTYKLGANWYRRDTIPLYI